MLVMQSDFGHLEPRHRHRPARPAHAQARLHDARRARPASSASAACAARPAAGIAGWRASRCGTRRLLAAQLEVAGRLATQATIVAGSRIERDQATGRSSSSITLQLALKTAR
jgi:hypothetical protein